MQTLTISDIKYHVTPEGLSEGVTTEDVIAGLPQELQIVVNDKYDNIASIISDQTGWLVESYHVQELE